MDGSHPDSCKCLQQLKKLSFLTEFWFSLNCLTSPLSPRERVVMQAKKTLVLVCLVFALSAFTVSAYADSQSVSNCTNCNGYTFQAGLTPVSGSPGVYALSYTITNVSGGTAQPYTWSLTLFDSGNNLSPVGPLTMSNGDQAAYKLLAGKSNNGNANCNSGISNAICVTPSGLAPLTTLSQGQSVTFTFGIDCPNCTELANWIFLSQGNCVTGAGNCYAISTPGSAVSMPEPSVLVLALCTLTVLCIALVWRNRSRIVAPPSKALG